ncbi:MAG: Oligoribonuclease [Candidatus Saccharibacteria bacterium]|nr:Oligoribonuclease [Candidatus Saccharibacteria bacterium]
MTKTAKILWIDLEMTGLDTSKDVILEIAAIVTDWEFKELATFEEIVHQSDRTLETMNEWSINQHGISGLTEKVRSAKKSSEQVEDDLLKFVDKNFEKDVPILLAGNSIHMDRRFIETQWKRVDAKLHYRMLDVSAWKVVFENKFKKKFAKPEEHRALGDIRGSIEELKYYLAKLK